MITTILVAVDGSDAGYAACRQAAEEARLRGAALHAVAVIHPHGYTGLLLNTYCDEEKSEACRNVREVLEKEAARIARSHGITLTPHTCWGQPAARILDCAGAVGAGLIVLGSTGKGEASRLLLGSVSSAVVDHSPVATMVVRK
jgi:nucleotide-binding universal stress UspA family protein